MKMKHIARLIPAALLTMAGTHASAAGFQLLEQNASGLGNAYAGTAAVADNASTIYFNPAGMTQLREREFSVGLNAVRPTFKFKDDGSTPTSAFANSGNGNDAGSWAFVPNAYMSWAVTQDLYLGVGIGAPFGLVTEYDDPWIGAAQAIKFDIKTLNINPSIAYRINDTVSVGAGVNWQRMEAEYVRRVSIVPFAALNTSQAKLDVDGDAWGWNVGVLFNLSDSTKLGMSYRSKVKHELSGDLTVTGANPLLNAAGTSKAKVDVDLPDTFIMSVSQQLNERWEMLGDVAWTGWSSIKALDIVRASGASSGDIAQTLDAEFRDTWRIALGANYKLNDAWKLKFGIAYDQTPVRGPDTRLVSLPDSNRKWLTVGAQWNASPSSTLDMGVAYISADESSINNDQTNLDPTKNRGKVSGHYDARVWILGAQYSMAF
jgi:long-chain fatty acid transport protein